MCRPGEGKLRAGGDGDAPGPGGVKKRPAQAQGRLCPRGPDGGDGRCPRGHLEGVSRCPRGCLWDPLSDRSCWVERRGLRRSLCSATQGEGYLLVDR